MEAQLKIVTKTEKGLEVQPTGEVFPLGQEKHLSVGRHSKEGSIEDRPHIIIDPQWPGAKFVSRKHLTLSIYIEGATQASGDDLSEEGVQIIDENSINGTYIDRFREGKGNVLGPIRTSKRYGPRGVEAGFSATGFGCGDGIRVWLGVSPDKFSEGQSAIVLDIFDPRPPLRTPEGGFGRLDFPQGPEGAGFAP